MNCPICGPYFIGKCPHGSANKTEIMPECACVDCQQLSKQLEMKQSDWLLACKEINELKEKLDEADYGEAAMEFAKQRDAALAKIRGDE